MTRRFIPVAESFTRWDEEPEFRAAYDALGEEFALAGALIKARADADMTQEQVARAMGHRRPCHPETVDGSWVSIALGGLKRVLVECVTAS